MGDFPAAIAPFMDQYGLLLRVLNPIGDIIPVQIIGPPEATSSAAAVLWARFVQGKTTAIVLQVPGTVQGMSVIMQKDFDRDVKEMEVELKVEVSKMDVMLWISGDDPKGVLDARQTIYEMLEYYMPDDFHIIGDLSPDLVERLRRNGDLRVLASQRTPPPEPVEEDVTGMNTESSKPACVVVLELEGSSGTAWICGKHRKEVRACIDSVASAPVEAPAS